MNSCTFSSSTCIFLRTLFSNFLSPFLPMSSFYSMSDHHRIWSSKNHRMKDLISCRDGLWNLMHKWIHILTWRLEFRFKIFLLCKNFPLSDSKNLGKIQLLKVLELTWRKDFRPPSDSIWRLSLSQKRSSAGWLIMLASLSSFFFAFTQTPEP